MANDRSSQQEALRRLEEYPNNYFVIVGASRAGCTEQQIKDTMTQGLETQIARCQAARSQERQKWGGAEDGENREYQGMYEGYKTALEQGGIDAVIREIPDCLK